MKLTAIPIVLLLLFSFLPNLSIAEDETSVIQIAVENSSLQKSYFQVKDSICSERVPNECKIAEFFLKSKKCMDRKWDEECTKSKEIVDGPECVEGIIFYSWLESGQSVQLNICTDHTGKGRISTRNSPTAPWTLFNWIEAGETITLK